MVQEYNFLKARSVKMAVKVALLVTHGYTLLLSHTVIELFINL